MAKRLTSIPAVTVGRANDATEIKLTSRHGVDMWFLLRGDVHFDNLECNTKLEKQHLDEAKERGAYVLDFGDLFDAMQGPHDRRQSLVALRNMEDRDDYFNMLLEKAEERFAPYAERMLFMASGNHEASVVRHSGLDLTKELIDRLRSKYNSPCMGGSFSGWIMLHYEMFAQPHLEKGVRRGLHIWYTHGKGGAAPVTRGVINTNRRAVYLPDADIIVSGHTHHSWMVPVARKRLSLQGVESVDEQMHVQLPSYKAPGQWEMEMEMAPMPTHGAYWLRVWSDRPPHKTNTHIIRYDIQRALS